VVWLRQFAVSLAVDRNGNSIPFFLFTVKLSVGWLRQFALSLAVDRNGNSIPFFLQWLGSVPYKGRRNVKLAAHCPVL